MTDPSHIADARKKVSRPQIREAFLRNGAAIPAERDDLPDWVYESVFELLDSVIQQAAPAIQYVAPAIQQAGPDVQGEPVACVPDQAKNERQATLSVDSERQAPDVEVLVDALEYLVEKYPSSRHLQEVCNDALSAHRKGGDV